MRNIRDTRLATLLLIGSLFGATPILAQDGSAGPRIGARLQVRALHADDEDTETMVHIRRARLSANGTVHDRFNYALQLELAGAQARLLDANVRTQVIPGATLWFGQGKAWFGRQQLTSSGSLQFVDRTITDARFSAGRRQGVGVLGTIAGGKLELNTGVFTGAETNVSSNPDDRYLAVVRLVWTPLGGYSPVESAHDWPESPRLALGASGMGSMARPGGAETDLRRLNGELAFKLRGFSATAELYRETLSPAAQPDVSTGGWYLQGGYLFPGRRHELAARRAAIDDEPGAGERSETGLAYSYYFAGHRAKVQADVRRLTERGEPARNEVRVQFQVSH
ncbi:MAG TPA: porin [Longimicrobiales bacterium]|nr:porin [Longimicrobiales bacterium]